MRAFYHSKAPRAMDRKVMVGGVVCIKDDGLPRIKWRVQGQFNYQTVEEVERYEPYYELSLNRKLKRPHEDQYRSSVHWR